MSITRHYDEAPVGSTTRVTLLGIAIFLIMGFGVARCLSPDPKGYGTHQQLGLPPCASQWLFGYPCPGCGMTTCFSHFVRGEFAQAARANVAGAVLATVCMLMIPWCLWSARRGRLWMVNDPVPVFGTLVISLGGLAVVLWVVRLIGVIG